MILRIVSIAFLGFTLAACGTYAKDRGLTGGAIGAPAGLVIGAIVGSGYPIIGTIAGAGLGATIGALTDPQTINLGEPLWNSSKFEW